MATLEKAPPSTASEQIVVFRLGSEAYGINIFRVSEIVRTQQATRLPQSADHVLGLIDLRGRTIPVLDLGTRLGLAPSDGGERSRVIVVEDDARLTGLQVDEVCEVLTIQGDAIEPPPAFGESNHDGWIRGVAKSSNRLIVLLDLERTLQG